MKGDRRAGCTNPVLVESIVRQARWGTVEESPAARSAGPAGRRVGPDVAAEPAAEGGLGEDVRLATSGWTRTMGSSMLARAQAAAPP